VPTMTTDEKKAQMIAALGEPLAGDDWRAIGRLADAAATMIGSRRATAESADLDARRETAAAEELDAKAEDARRRADAYAPTIATSLTDRNQYELLAAEAGHQRAMAARHRERATAFAVKARAARRSSDRARAQLAALQQGRLLVAGDDQVDAELLKAAGRDVVERLAAAGRTLDA
jgi:hypothetical protein